MNVVFDEESQLWVADGDEVIDDEDGQLSPFERLDEAEDALIELAEIIAGGE